MENLERERDLLELARHATASQLERLVRSYRGVVVAQAAARGGRPERWLAWTHDDDGSVLLRARLPAEEGAAVIGAIEAGVQAAYDDARHVSAETPDERAGVSAETSATPAGEGGNVSAETPDVPAGERGSVSAETPDPPADGPESVSAETHDVSVGQSGGVSAETPGTFAGEGGGVSAETPGTSAGEAGGVSAETPDPPSDGRGSVSAETPERAADGFYAPSREAGNAAMDELDHVAADTLELTAGERRADALLALADSYLASGPAARTGGERHQVIVHVDAPTLANQNDSGRCELHDGSPLSPDTARRLACDGAIVHLLEHDATTLDIGRKTRAIPPALQRALTARDRGCRFPGCTATRHLDAHHITHWADGGPTKLANLLQLCRHHHRLIHEGGYTITTTPDGHHFHRPDGRPIPPNQTLPPAPPPRHHANIDHRSCRTLSLGDRLDLDLGVQALLTYAPLATAQEAPGI